MVNIEINATDIGLVVRFTRRTWGGFFKWYASRLDAIIVVAPQFEEDVLADFAIYRQLSEAAQAAYIKAILTTRYSGRLLSVTDLEDTATAMASLPV